MKKQDAKTIKANLAQFCGSENYYRSSFKHVVYTDGVKYLADAAGAYWLIDAIASHQRPPVSHEAFQVWRFTVTDQRGLLVADDGNGRQIARQEIDYTDFCLPEIKLYLVTGSLNGKLVQTLMLPGEY